MVCCAIIVNFFEVLNFVIFLSYILQNAGLAQSTGEGWLKEAFSRCGEVSRGMTYSKPFYDLGTSCEFLCVYPSRLTSSSITVKLVLDKKTKQSLGCAYVWFVREEHAVAAIEEMNGQVKTHSAFI